MQYKAIGFDWGGVINGRPGAAFAEAAATTLRVSREAFLNAYYKYNAGFQRGEIPSEKLWTHVCTDLGQPDKWQQLNTMHQKFNEENVNANVLTLIDTLRKKGYKVGLLSNNTSENEAIMLKSGLDKHFDVFHISADTKLVKPDPKAFLNFAIALGVEINELVFVDDSIKSLSTAEQCGFTPILYTSYTDLLKDLSDIGISI